MVKLYSVDQLTESQKEQYELLLEKFQDVESPDSFRTNDPDLYLRFLHGSHFDVDKCIELLTEALAFHNKWRPDLIEMNSNLKPYTSTFFWFGKSLKDLPTLIIKAKNHNPHMRVMDHVKQYILYLFYKGEQLMDKENVSQWIVILDREGATKRNNDMELVKWMASIQKFYPERANKVFILHPNFLFNMLFKMITPFADAKTVQKVEFVGKDFKIVMRKHYDPYQLLIEHGGKSKYDEEHDGIVKLVRTKSVRRRRASAFIADVLESESNASERDDEEEESTDDGEPSESVEYQPCDTTFEDLCALGDASNNGWTGDDSDDALYADVAILIADEVLRLGELLDATPAPPLAGLLVAAAACALMTLYRDAATGVLCGLVCVLLSCAVTLRYRDAHSRTIAEKMAWRRRDNKARRLASIGARVRATLDTLEYLAALCGTLPVIALLVATLAVLCGSASFFSLFWLATVAFLFERLMKNHRLANTNETLLEKTAAKQQEQPLSTASRSVQLAKAAERCADASTQHAPVDLATGTDRERAAAHRRAMAAAIMLANDHAGVKRRDVWRGVKHYRGVFSGKDVIDWLLSRHSDATTRKEALFLARMCATSGVIQPVLQTDELAEPFNDDDTLWRFNQDKLKSARASLRVSAAHMFVDGEPSPGDWRAAASMTAADWGRIFEIAMPSVKVMATDSAMRPGGKHIYVVRKGLVAMYCQPTGSSSSSRRRRRTRDSSDSSTASARTHCNRIDVNDHFGTLAALGVHEQAMALCNVQLAVISRKTLDQFLISEPLLASKFWLGVAVRAAEQYEILLARDGAHDDATSSGRESDTDSKHVTFDTTPRKHRGIGEHEHAHAPHDDDSELEHAQLLHRRMSETNGVSLKGVRHRLVCVALGDGVVSDAVDAAMAGDGGLLWAASASHTFGPLSMHGHLLVGSTRAVFVGSMLGRLHVDIVRYVDIISVSFSKSEPKKLKVLYKTKDGTDKKKWLMKDKDTAQTISDNLLEARDNLLNGYFDTVATNDDDTTNDNDDDEPMNDDDDDDDESCTEDESAEQSTNNNNDNNSNNSENDDKSLSKKSKRTKRAHKSSESRRKTKRKAFRGGLDDDDWKLLAPVIQPQRASADEVLQHVSHSVHSLFVVGDACTIVDESGESRATLRAGELFGVSSWLLRRPSFLSLTTLRDQEYSTISIDQLQTLLESSPALAARVYYHMALVLLDQLSRLLE